MNVVLAVMIVLTVVPATASAAEPKYSGFLWNLYKNLQSGIEGQSKMIWMKPGVMFGKYDKFMVDSVIFFFCGWLGIQGNRSERGERIG